MKRLSFLALLSALAGVAGLAVPAPAAAQPKAPRFTVSGYLTDTVGNPIATEVQLNVRLYTDVAAATSAAFLTESFTLTPGKDGFFSVAVGSTVALDPAKFDLDLAGADPNVYLGLQVEGEGEMSPRFKLSSAPWALSVDWSGVTNAPDFALAGHSHAFGELTGAPAELLDGDQGVTLAAAPLEISADGRTVSLSSAACAGGQVLKFNGAAFACADDATESGSGGGTVTSVSAAAPLTVTNPSTTPALSLPQASATSAGYLSSADWTAFNGKLGSITATAPLTATGGTVGLSTAGCASGQALKFNGTGFACAADATGSGTVTSVTAGAGLSGGTITGSGTISLTSGCSSGQVLKANGTGGWACAADANSGGTVTSVAAGTGLTGGTITGSGTLAVSYGTSAGTACQGNDSRLSNARAPTAGSTHYVQNQTSTTQTASFRINGSGTVGTLTASTPSVSNTVAGYLVVGGTTTTGLGGPTRLRVDGATPAFLAGSDSSLGFNTYSAGGANGWTYASNNVAGWIALGTSANGKLAFGMAPSGTAGNTFNAGNLSTLVIAADGKVGIGSGVFNATLGQALHVVGDAFKTAGGTAWASTSDARLKKGVAPLTNALERLLALRGVSFEWKDPERWGGPGRHIGFVAQEVEPVMPEWMREGPDGYKAVSPEGFEALTVEGLRELKQENERLRGELRSLERRLAALERAATARR